MDTHITWCHFNISPSGTGIDGDMVTWNLYVKNIIYLWEVSSASKDFFISVFYLVAYFIALCCEAAILTVSWDICFGVKERKSHLDRSVIIVNEIIIFVLFRSIFVFKNCAKYERPLILNLLHNLHIWISPVNFFYYLPDIGWLQ